MAPIEREIRDFANGLKTIKDEQEYIVVRERRHRNTAESTNSRVKWWSIFQAIVLFAMVGWQVYYLKVRQARSILDTTRSTTLLVVLRSEKGLLSILCTYLFPYSTCLLFVGLSTSANLVRSSDVMCRHFASASRLS